VKSLTDGVAAVVVGAAHMKGLLEEALVGTAVVCHNTSGYSAVIATLARHTSGVGHDLKEMQQRLESSIVECGKGPLAGMVASFAQQP
jgi:hypothetical protein